MFTKIPQAKEEVERDPNTAAAFGKDQVESKMLKVPPPPILTTVS